MDIFKKSQFILINSFLLVICYQKANSQSLFVCEENGMKTIVSRTQGNHCQPYNKEMFGNRKIIEKKESPKELEKTIKTNKKIKEIIPNESTKEIEESEVVTEKKLWVCPTIDGSTITINSADQPLDSCIITNEKPAEKNQPIKIERTYKGKAARVELFTESKSGDMPQDIYKCFDSLGNPTYVSASQRGEFRQCSFWSRSFAAVERELKTQNLTMKVPENTHRLYCSGAGTVIFAGQKREYNCATHSFDYSAGTTGGEIKNSERAITIEAHNLDYFSDKGNCGGTITSENGRIFHLEPTKECPANVLKVARRIAKEVAKSLNVHVSGEFKERQRRLTAQINRIAFEIGVEPHFVHAIISAESAYKPRAKSRAGAMGLMQLMPATARRFGVNDPYNTEQNIRAGTTYLRFLLNEFGSMELAAAGYNAGEGNVKKYGRKIPPFIETKAYVPKVMEYYRRYKANPIEIGL